MDLFRTLNDDEQTTVLSYTVEVGNFSSPQEVAELFADDVSPRLKELIMTLAEKLRAEGKISGQQELLLSQLRARFPNEVSTEVEARVMDASKTQVSAWGVRVLTAKTLDEVFAE